MALPPSALLCFWYTWLAVAVDSAVHNVLERFQRPHVLELSTFSPASTELGECYWESLQFVLNSESVSVPQIARCYLSILFVETLGTLVTILLSLLLPRVYVLQRRALWDIEFGCLWPPDSATICATLSIHHAQFLTNEMAGAQKCHTFQVDILWSFSSYVTSHFRAGSIWTNSSFKVAFGITCTMNFVCSIFPDCHLRIENSASFHHLSFAWIPEDNSQRLSITRKSEKVTKLADSENGFGKHSPEGHTQSCIYTYVHMYVHLYVHSDFFYCRYHDSKSISYSTVACTHTHTNSYIYVYTLIYKWIHMYVCVYIYKYITILPWHTLWHCDTRSERECKIQRERARERQREKETAREREKNRT